MGKFPSASGGGVNKGTAAARPAANALANQLYWATDTDSISFSDGANWHNVRQLDPTGNDVNLGGANNFGNLQIAGINFLKLNSFQPQFLAKFRTVAGMEAAGATAGGGAAPPATVQGYFVFTDSGGVDRKIPYYAN